MDTLAVLSVVAMGICTVFVCLVCIIIICKIMSGVVITIEKKAAPVTPVVEPALTPAVVEVPDRQLIVAAIGSAIAEDMGIDISHLKIHSIKKL